MDRTKYVLTLKIPVEVWADTGHASALCDTKTVLEDSGYQDGRHPFAREMFVRGLSEMLRHAAFESVQRMMTLKYGDERVQVENGDYLRSYAEASKWMEGDLKSIGVDQDGWQVDISAKWPD